MLIYDQIGVHVFKISKSTTYVYVCFHMFGHEVWLREITISKMLESIIDESWISQIQKNVKLLL